MGLMGRPVATKAAKTRRKRREVTASRAWGRKGPEATPPEERRPWKAARGLGRVTTCSLSQSGQALVNSGRKLLTEDGRSVREPPCQGPHPLTTEMQEIRSSQATSSLLQTPLISVVSVPRPPPPTDLRCVCLGPTSHTSRLEAWPTRRSSGASGGGGGGHTIGGRRGENQGCIRTADNRRRRAGSPPLYPAFIVGKNEIYKRKHGFGLFFGTQIFRFQTAPPSPPLFQDMLGEK